MQAKKIAPCHACYFCREHGGECAYKDDMAEILQAMIDADVLVLASPVYFYSIDAQLKAVIDRTVARCILRSPADSDAFQSGRYAEHNGHPETPDFIV